MESGTGARMAAALLVEGVAGRRLSLADQAGERAMAGLSPSDRARAQRLALATLRRLDAADRILKPFLRKEPPTFVRALLRLAVTEILSEGAPAHAVVHDAVTIVRGAGQRAEAFAGLVNAVLRRAGETDPARFAALPPQALPGWLRGRLMSAWGKAATLAIEAAHARGAPLDLTPRDGTAADLAARLGGVALPTGSVRLTGFPPLAELPGYAEGDWWVQDAAAAVAARALAARPGERVLDLCAAPGGKTLQLAAAGADVTALDISEARMARVGENLNRCRLSARTIVADALEWQPGHRFDAILLDAPCSATGTIRRHPDLPLVRDAGGLKDIFALQSALIDCAVSLLGPGGRLVYATCSLLPDEGERQLDAALARHEMMEADPAAVSLPGLEPGWIGPHGGLRLRPDYWPDTGGMDGFFIAALRRRD